MKVKLASLSLRYHREVAKQSSLVGRPETLHVIIPHCTNWTLTTAAANAFIRLTRRPVSVTVVNNFDETPVPSTLFAIPQVTLIRHRLTAIGKTLRKIIRTRQGSLENAIGLDSGLLQHPHFTWAFMAHSDSAPLIKNWDDFYFSGLSNGELIIGNYRDRIRIHAAHASGTLFHQKTFFEKGGNMRPEFEGDTVKLDVGDRATLLLHDLSHTPVPVLPNTINRAELIDFLEKNHTTFGVKLGEFARTGSCISFDCDAKIPVFGHLGRGTPRNLQDPKFKGRPSVDYWIDLINSVS